VNGKILKRFEGRIVRFKQFLNESNTSGASDMEEVIVKLWNKEPLEGKLAQYEEPGKEVIKFLKKKKIGTKKASWSGRGAENVTPFWSQFGASNKTPKTDLSVAGKDISLKQGPAQLMSGGKEESYATFMAAVKNSGNSLDKKLISKITSHLNNFQKGLTKSGTVADNVKAGKDTVIMEGERTHKEMMSTMSEVFTDNIDFRREFL
jgi:hypothetical protein